MSEFEPYLKQRIPYVTLGIIIANFAVFFYESILPLPELYAFFEVFGAVPAKIVNFQDLHTLITSMFIHGSFIHIFFNMYFLLIFGGDSENAFGSAWFLIFYITCGVLSGFFHSYIAYYLIPDLAYATTIGASGAIFGVLAAYALFFPNRPLYTFFGVWRAAYFVLFVVAIETIMAIFPFATYGIAHTAHIGGFIAGAVFASIFKAARRGPFRKKKKVVVYYF
ncbi:MAG: rhomboid family intramembrane serine protease [Candidatus Odinarchaeia archaeon]